jgi:tetratricopeptide (TPR) repeat protein
MGLILTMAEEDDDDLLIFSGAGISKPLGIPDMYSFVEEFKSQIEKDMRDKKDLLDNVINNEKIDLEELLKRLNRMSELLEDETYLRMVNQEDDEKMIFSEIKELKEKLMDFVYEECSSFDEEVAQRIFKQLFDLKDLFLHDRLKIFTTNYDICAESTYEKQNLACTTGFKTRGMYPIWDRTAFKDPSYKIHIYKLHGSITWFKYGDQITQLPPIDRQIFSSRGEELPVQMLYPLTGKEVFKPPFSELQYYLQKTLESCSMCIVIGYSFRDDSINSIFSNASKENKDLEVIVIDPNADEILKRLDFEVTIIPKWIEDVDLEEEFLKFVKTRANKLRSKAMRLRDSREHKKGIEVGKKAIKLAQRVDDFDCAGYAAGCVSDCFMYINNDEKKIEYAKKSVEFYEKIEQRRGAVYHNLGIIYNRLGNKEKAIENFKEAEKAYEKEDKTERIEKVREWITQLEKIAEE